MQTPASDVLCWLWLGRPLAGGKDRERSLCIATLARENRPSVLRVPGLDLPGWTIDLSERSAGVWRLEAIHETGRSFDVVDSDVDRAFQSLKDYDARTFGSPPDRRTAT